VILKEVAKSNQSRQKTSFPRCSSEKETFRSLVQTMANLLRAAPYKVVTRTEAEFHEMPLELEATAVR